MLVQHSARNASTVKNIALLMATRISIPRSRSHRGVAANDQRTHRASRSDRFRIEIGSISHRDPIDLLLRSVDLRVTMPQLRTQFTLQGEQHRHACEVQR